MSLSIGWGIRGNYGHEIGAMFPGALAALAACLVSGRDDWHRRFMYFGCFGALGWAFGGSISYMQVIAYTHSGHLPSQLYGFAGLFLIGFLWAALGGGGTALPAAMDRQRLAELFRPLSVLLMLWAIMYFVLPWALVRVQQIEGANKRQDSVLYWLDTDWLEVLVLLTGLLLYDLVDRRGKYLVELAAWLVAGAVAGWMIHQFLWVTGLGGLLWNLLVRPQGDVANFPVDQLVTNWPNAIVPLTNHLGWMCGMALAAGLHFARRGQFRHGSGLMVHMALGWYAGFVLLTVVLGLRLTPPRGDNWAGILGTAVAAIVWCYRNRLQSVAYAALFSGAIGGFGFSFIALVKLMMVAPGNPAITSDPGVLAAWRHWQSANWHSFLEQSYGFVNGLGIALAMGRLSTRLPRVDESGPRSRWTEGLALAVALPILVFLNTVQNIDDWTKLHGTHQSVADVLQAPLFDSWQWSAFAWFFAFYSLAAAAFMGLWWVHPRRPIALVPRDPIGQNQLAFFLLLWAMVLANWAKAIPAFNDQRLLTEGVITVHAVIATVLALLVPGAKVTDLRYPVSWRPHVQGALRAALVVLALWPPLATLVVRSVYGSHHAGHAGQDFRFGPNANWKVKPVLRGTEHR